MSFDLKVDIVDKIDSCDWNEKPINCTNISSQQHQHPRKIAAPLALGHDHPWVDSEQ